jgi:hypothetical protein
MMTTLPQFLVIITFLMGCKLGQISWASAVTVDSSAARRISHIVCPDDPVVSEFGLQQSMKSFSNGRRFSMGNQAFQVS